MVEPGGVVSCSFTIVRCPPSRRAPADHNSHTVTQLSEKSFVRGLHICSFAGCTAALLKSGGRVRRNSRLTLSSDCATHLVDGTRPV